MGDKGRWEYLRAIYGRYQKAGRKAKKVILDEFCENTGYHRKYAIRDSHFPTAATTTNFRLHFKCLDKSGYGYIVRWLDRAKLRLQKISQSHLR